MTSIKIATCQFPVSADVARNLSFVRRQAERAAALGAEVAHFPEAALSGYAGVNLTARGGYDWPALRAATERVQDVARRLEVWIIVGSAHPLSGNHKPHNSVYVFRPDGALVDRYDKLFCTKKDLNYYTPGDYFAVFDIRGVRCGLLICHDMRYPELYREYYRRGVQVLFQSFYNASNSGPTIHSVIVQPTMQAHAANNYMWMSVANASGSYQAWPSFFVSPEGGVLGRLRRNQAGVMVNVVDTKAPIKDKCGFRANAMAGVLHSGETVEDPRSSARQTL